ncbi:DUF3102 domain-containing protein [Paenibacillus sp. MAHUQ-46]|uniref:DUF3102 domain-containing protein n=1 Tax=Paenibacillus roseus TaxID=2798579 RepID=A0A934MLF1_9BACL|nr:DUF3102 domain-containing protein [Paenibacillus roseus]
MSNRTPEVIAAEIRTIDQQARQAALQGAIEIGKRLTEAKELVTHGEWGDWLKSNVNYSQSTANNFMRVADQYASSTSQAIANLSYSQAVALLSVPSEDREQFAEDNNASEMSSRELQEAIKARKELEQQLQAEQQRQTEQKAEYDAWAADQAQVQKELEERYQLSSELKEQAEKQVADLQAELDKAKEGGDDKAVAKLRTDLRKADKARQTEEKKAAELQQQLDNFKAAAEKAATEMLQRREKELAEQAKQREQQLADEAAKRAADLQAELDKVRQQLERSNNEPFLRGKMFMQQLVTNGDGVVKAIAEVSDKAEQDKLTHAAVTVIKKLLDRLQPPEPEKAK